MKTPDESMQAEGGERNADSLASASTPAPATATATATAPDPSPSVHQPPESEAEPEPEPEPEPQVAPKTTEQPTLVALAEALPEPLPTGPGQEGKTMPSSNKAKAVSQAPAPALAPTSASALASASVSSPSISLPAGTAMASATVSSTSRHIRKRSKDGKTFTSTSLRPSLSMNSLESYDRLDRSVRSYSTMSTVSSNLSGGSSRRKSGGVLKSSAIRTISSMMSSEGQGYRDHHHQQQPVTIRRRNSSDKSKLDINAKTTSAPASTSSSTVRVHAPTFALNQNIKKPKMKKPSQCQLFCAFYAEFDDIVGPQVCFQSPRHFMDHDIAITMEEIKGLLERSFQFHNDNHDHHRHSPDKSTSMEGSVNHNQCTTNSVFKTNLNANDVKEMKEEEHDHDVNHVSTPSPPPQQQSSRLFSDENDNGESDQTIPQMNEPSAPNSDKKAIIDEKPTIPHNSDSIFDSTCEYIITGNELTGQIISLSTHNMHIISRPTIIKDKRYERNALLFNVGFVIRRNADPSPFKPVLARLVKTLQRMEIESQFLSSPNTKQRIQEILDIIVPSLNSPESKCHLLLDDANVLHLQCFPPPKPHAPSVPEYVVPVLLRPEHQLQTYDWDLTIKWIVLFINGVDHAKLIAEEAKVDEETVLSCLRVLRHHNVLACVDQFRYSNVYEATPKAQQMLAGDMDGLLTEAFRFVAKPLPPLPPQESVAGSGSFQQATSVDSLGNLNSNNNNSVIGNGPTTITSLRVGNSSDHHEGMPMTLLPPMDTTTPSSYPPLDRMLRRPETTQNSSSFGNNTRNGAGIYIVNNPPTPTRNGSIRSGTTPSSKESSQYSHMNVLSLSSGNLIQPPLSTTNSTTNSNHGQLSKEKQRIMMAALAFLYTSCERGVTLGDVWLNKVAQALPTDEVPETVAEDSIPTANQRRGKNGRKMRTKSKARSHSIGSTMASTKVTTDMVDKIDWAEVFDFFDHHRFVTFGVIHGLIRRVHEFPIAVDTEFNDSDDVEKGDEDEMKISEDDDEDETINEDETLVFNNKQLNHLPPRSTSYLKRHTTSPGFSPKFSPKISPAPGQISSHAPPHLSLGPSAVGTFSSSTGSLKRYSSSISNHSVASNNTTRSIKNIRDRSKEIAASMDGTRCDDELYVMHDNNIKELKNLVKKYCGKDVISIYSVSQQ